ncbi:lysoplasmalogenase [Sungkyunkwania multivorans]|uniref:Lysoplasmalogenase n=1 Tax=Sungkyunkwania multivorans TaxID=1173618 RepID=A0ABW3CSU9_9FLAO
MKSILFNSLFFLILTLDIVFSNFDHLLPYRVITKPAVIGSLLVYFYLNSAHLIKEERRFLLLALVFLLLGDILFLKFDDTFFFFLGMASFMLGNIMYSLAFHFYVSHRFIRTILFSIVLLAYAYGLLNLIIDGLEALFVPVLIFMVVVFTMLQSAFSRLEAEVPRTAYFLVFTGGLLFMFSESIIAYSKFYKPFPFEDIFIMLTYGLGQYFIIMGMTYKRNTKAKKYNQNFHN